MSVCRLTSQCELSVWCSWSVDFLLSVLAQSANPLLYVYGQVNTRFAVLSCGSNYRSCWNHFRFHRKIITNPFLFVVALLTSGRIAEKSSLGEIKLGLNCENEFLLAIPTHQKSGFQNILVQFAPSHFRFFWSIRRGISNGPASPDPNYILADWLIVRYLSSACDQYNLFELNVNASSLRRYYV